MTDEQRTMKKEERRMVSPQVTGTCVSSFDGKVIYLPPRGSFLGAVVEVPVTLMTQE
jgi:hypothetical protein